ncbi:hypothetical protein OG760_30250 [Streptomyces sp. NBC_00963]|uniref:hypothetical protein n=1 Tax=unclassified Streptomyces TaxID=2593676 RepID=UPI00224F3AFA|nr:hypothetical protein [Streptomyces sp. NBC_01306]MCX4722829.1 hypothetical protein [Streptomyces sp. NBC_01306]WSX45627.1 hypothetical protein OG760_30250 [Streptomyces sp. NBC_00963]
MANEYSPPTSMEWGDQRNVNELLKAAWAQADTLPDPAQVHLALAWTVSKPGPPSAPVVQQVRDAGGRGAEILREFTHSLQRALDEESAEAEPRDMCEGTRSKPKRRAASKARTSDPGDRRRRRHIESADEALKRQAEPELINEILAGGAVAASFTAAAGVAKAKIEATTQRRKNDLDADTQRLKIASDERIAMLQPRFQEPVFQTTAEDAEPDDA